MSTELALVVIERCMISDVYDLDADFPDADMENFDLASDGDRFVGLWRVDGEAWIAWIEDPTPSHVNIPPSGLALSQNRPNPFNPVTTIPYTLDGETTVRIDIYDASGGLVRSFDEGWQEGGPHHVVWNGRDDGGRLVSSGVYFYRLRAGSSQLTRKMLLVK